MTAGPGGWLRDTGTLYVRTFRKGALLAVRNWPVGLVVVLYAALLGVVRFVTAPFGIVGGLLLYLAMVACVSSWLSLVECVIRVGRVRIEDLWGGFGAYLNDLLAVAFLLFVLRFVASIVLAPSPLLQIVFGLAVIAFFNAVPELIYLGRHSASDLLVQSYQFIGENWIEWFPANVILAACVLATTALPPGPYGLLAGGAAGVVLYFAMIVRGLLFLELSSAGRRAREFRRRATG